MSDRKYLSAIVTFLQRDTDTQTAMTYPITRIELLSMPSETNLLGEPRRVFVVDDNGDRWVEEPRPAAAVGEDYVCEGCGRTFQKAVSDEAAAAEASAIFPAELLEDKALVCDDCFRSTMSNFVAHYERLRARAAELREMIARSHGEIAHHIYLDELLAMIEIPA